MAEFTGSVVKYPARASFVWYIGLILLGTLILSRPSCHASAENPISLLDAFFTATSAACVTGLAVRSTAHDFSFLGQLTILVLIQLGGIGIMTVTTYVMFQLGGRQGLRTRAVISETLGIDDKTDLMWILRHVMLFALGFELAGFLLLLGRNLYDYSVGNAIWHAAFHSISAFCNAGFALHDDSLTRYQGDVFVNLTIATLIIVGGIGFPVILDLQQNGHGSWRERWERLHLNSKIMLIGTVALLLLGTISFLLLEWDGVLIGTPISKRVLIAFFHSVSCRTAGFNTVDMATLTNAMLFISILLMLIGAGPCSTAGGFKVSTVAVLVLRAWKTFQGHAGINVFRRTIPAETIERATATAMLFTVLAAVSLTSLLVFEQSAVPHPHSQGLFLDAGFEIVSALATVGLSLGMTPSLTTAGRCILVCLMFLGRLGPISVFAALSRGQQTDTIEFPTEEPLIG